MLIIPYFRDGVVVKADDLERLKIYSHDLAIAASNTTSPGVLYGLTLLKSGGVFRLQPGAARLDSGEIVVVSSTDSITIPVSTVASSLLSGTPPSTPIYLYKFGTALVSDRQNLVNVAQVVADKNVFGLSTSIPTVADKVLLGTILQTSPGVYTFNKNPATASNTHTNQWAGGIYTGPLLHGTNAIIPLSITNPSIGDRTILEGKIVDRTLIRRNINQAYGLVWPGSVMSYAGTGLNDFIPVGNSYGPTISGWRVCDGAALPIPTTASSPYIKLYNAIGTTYGGSSGFFNLPNLQGVFIRGYDGTTGTARRDEAGRAFGSYQTDALRNHRHRQINGYDDKNFTNSYGQSCPGDGTYHTQDGRETSWVLPDAGVSISGFETRPKNIAMHYIIYTGEYYLA